MAALIPTLSGDLLLVSEDVEVDQAGETPTFSPPPRAWCVARLQDASTPHPHLTCSLVPRNKAALRLLGGLELPPPAWQMNLQSGIVDGANLPGYAVTLNPASYATVGVWILPWNCPVPGGHAVAFFSVMDDGELFPRDATARRVVEQCRYAGVPLPLHLPEEPAAP